MTGPRPRPEIVRTSFGPAIKWTGLLLLLLLFLSLLLLLLLQVSSAPAANLARWAADQVRKVFTSTSASASGSPATATPLSLCQVAPSYWRPNAEITNCNSCAQRSAAVIKVVVVKLEVQWP